MKNYLLPGLLLAMLITVFSACSSNAEQASRNPISTVHEDITAVQTGDVKKPSEPSLEVVDTVLYTIPEYSNGIYIAARFKNTGELMAQLNPYDCSFDIEDELGNFVYHLENVVVIPPLPFDGFGYIVGVDLDLPVDLVKCRQAQVNLSYDVMHPDANGDSHISEALEIEDINVSEYSGYFYSTPGRIVNDRQYNIDNVKPVIVLYDANGKFLGVNIDMKSYDLAANSKHGFSGESGEPIPLSAFTEDDIGSIKGFAVFDWTDIVPVE